MKHWISAMRLRTLPLALASIGMGAFLAAEHGGYRSSVFILCLLTTISLQILSNLANDYGDTVHGADNSDREGPSRAVQSGAISLRQMRLAMGIAVVVCLALGIALLMVAGVSMKVFVIFIVLGLVAIIAAVLYTNGVRPYGYIGLGDLSVFLFFGWLGVLGTFYLQTGYVTWDLLLPGAACGLFTVAVLNVNNIRDIESDIKAGKFSIPVRLGRQRATMYHMALLVIGFSCALLYTYIHYEQVSQLLYLLVIPLLFINARAVMTKMAAQDLDPYLKQMAISTLVFVLCFGIGNLL